MAGTTREVFGAVEGGGTKFVCMLGTSPTDVVDEVTIPTADPAETLGAVVQFLGQPRTGLTLASVGIAMFGPIGLNPASPTYGCTLGTPKPGWSGVRIVAPLARRLGVPIGWDTDVNGAVLGEARWGAAQGIDPAIYLTVGTGIGGGALVNGQTIHGVLHPEMGHIPMPTVEGDTFPGACTYHGRCLEGLASGPALTARLGHPLAEIATDDPVWRLTARYLAYGLATYILTLSPRRIVLGGGVMHQTQLFPLLRRAVAEILNGYVNVPELSAGLDEYIVPSALDHKAGLYGALALAERAAATREANRR